MSPTEARSVQKLRHPLAITFAANQEPRDWNARFNAGETSSAWPYGLNFLNERFAVQPSIRNRPSVPALGAFLARTLTARAAKRRARAEHASGYAFAWDENLAIRSLLANRGRRQISGLIWASQEPDSQAKALKRAVTRLALRQMDGIFVQSTAQLESARRWLGSPTVPLVYIPMAVSVDFFRPTPYPQTPFVFSMGNDKHRDPALLAEALRLVLEAIPAAQVLVQTNRPELFPRGVVTVNRLSTEEVLRCYARASVVAIATLPNDHVSGITVALEAMASGRPVVMSAAPGLQEYINDGINGFLTSQGDAASFAARINELLADPALGEEMGTKARARVEAEFSLQVMNAAIADFIDSIPLVY